MRDDEDMILDHDEEDTILPVDEEAAEAEKLVRLQREYDTEIDEANADVYDRAFVHLLDSGYDVEQAEAYKKHPEVIKNIVDKMKEESFLAFQERYPHVKPEEISKETWKAFERTGDLIYSFEKYDSAFAGFNDDMPKVKVNRTNRRHGKPDPFLAGFDEEF